MFWLWTHGRTCTHSLYVYDRVIKSLWLSRWIFLGYLRLIVRLFLHLLLALQMLNNLLLGWSTRVFSSAVALRLHIQGTNSVEYNWGLRFSMTCFSVFGSFRSKSPVYYCSKEEACQMLLPDLELLILSSKYELTPVGLQNSANLKYVGELIELDDLSNRHVCHEYSC